MELDSKSIRLDCYRVHENPMVIESATPYRAWMDQTDKKFAYRCTPMTIANTSGWELKMPHTIDVTWDGKAAVDALRISYPEQETPSAVYAASHFGYGVLTFMSGWLFRTDPGWAIWVRGRPNLIKKGIFALEGIVETDWLVFPFTINWRFIQPGTIRFSAGETIAFISLFPHGWIDKVQPEILDICDNRYLNKDYRDWSRSRNHFNDQLNANNPEFVQRGWEKKYLRGDHPRALETFHVTKRKLHKPI